MPCLAFSEVLFVCGQSLVVPLPALPPCTQHPLLGYPSRKSQTASHSSQVFLTHPVLLALPDFLLQYLVGAPRQRLCDANKLTIHLPYRCVFHSHGELHVSLVIHSTRCELQHPVCRFMRLLSLLNKSSTSCPKSTSIPSALRPPSYASGCDLLQSYKPSQVVALGQNPTPFFPFIQENELSSLL